MKYCLPRLLALLSFYWVNCEDSSIQRFDGWYNNLAFPRWGTAGEKLVHNISSVYEDYTYQPTCSGRPSARLVSNALFRQNTSTDSGGSYNNRTAFFAFFGQLVSFEVSDTDDTTCPIELLEIPVPKCDPDFDAQCTGTRKMPYERIKYDKHTGQSPNTPRQQVNSATSFIDGSFVYGPSIVRTNFLRQDRTGHLASGDSWGKYPEPNVDRLPYMMYPSIDGKMSNVDKLWKMGDNHVHENPAILSLGILFFRYHNYLATKLHREHTNWHYRKVFYNTRRNVIASLQKIIMYDWLPDLLGVGIKPYTGYRSSLEPGISSVFDAAAIKYIMTLVPSAITRRNNNCKSISWDDHKAVRLCNSYFNSQNILLSREDGVEEMIMGMVSESAEKEDLNIVEDIQSKFYGPLHFSRHDFVAQTIMRGRDYGLPDYNSVRKAVGLKPVSTWAEINVELNKTNPEIFVTVENIYKELKHLDVFVGGMLETTPSGPGELFRIIILDQFYRIRDGDRFWFENKDNGLFTEEQVEQIKNITLYDIIVNSTKLDTDHIQRDVFTVSQEMPCKPLRISTSELEPCGSHHGYDYFAGSEVTYIIIWTCFGLIPLVCILCAYIAAKCRQWKHSRHVKRQQHYIGNQQRNNDLSTNKESEFQYQAEEWLGAKEDSRLVSVQLKLKCQLSVLSARGTRLRTINMDFIEEVQIWISNNKGQKTIVVKMPKEYDMILVFPNYNMRSSFLTSLTSTLKRYGKKYTIMEMRLKTIYDQAVTQKKRNMQLEKFFKSVFSEAFDMDYDPNLENHGVETAQVKEMLSIELTKEEFAHALACKPDSEFVENMFSLLDSDRNGYISFRDFLNAVVLFSKGTCQEKLHLLFRMFDMDGKGCLQKEELSRMFGSLLEMANNNISKPDLESLVESMCSENGLNDQSSYNFEDFCQLLSPQMDKIWNAGLEWKGRKNCYPSNDKKRIGKSPKASPKPKKVSPKASLNELSKLSPNSSPKNSPYPDKSIDIGRRKSSTPNIENRRKSSIQPSTCSDDSRSNSLKSSNLSDAKFVAVREKYSPLKSKLKTVAHFIENNRQHIFFLVLFFGICLGLFTERFYYYTVEREHSGLRALMSYGISTTRGAAAAMSFTFSLLLLTMCRNMITWLRGTFLNLYIPFDSHVAFHKVVAWSALFFTGLHVIGYSINFYQLATQPTKHLCVFDSVVLRTEALPGFEFWFFGNMTGCTGVLLVVVICIIYVFATQTARQFIFNGFWLTHKLIVIMYVLTILHGASVIVQKPMFFVYFIVPAILFAMDKMISLSRKKTEIAVLGAEKLPSDITFLQFKRPSKFEYKSGQWVRIACLSHGRNEFHPFTITSAPHEDTLSLHIRALGPWTWNIRNLFDPESLKDGPYPKLFLDGPYGAGQQDWYQYEVSVLVGAGIGVTPYASILKDFVHMAQMRSTYKMKCQKLYFIWVTGSQRHFEWLLDIIREVEEVDQKGIVSIDIFITQFFQNFDLRTCMLYICEEHFQKLSGGRSLFTGLKATTHFGRPQLSTMFQAVHKTHPMVRKVGVFSCGPPGLTKSVEVATKDASNTTKALFEHHFENF
ncbi:dual oxidase-like isoform X1 [Mytilus trossulus]|uniref:dual oxidase-like isoform X1 n=2 Tax=Mytilus trossulus TaxID=6551 RepID=UPI0030063CDB